METNFTFRNIEASGGLKEHTLEKLKKLGKYMVKPTTAHVIFYTERFQHVVEITLNANGIQHVCQEKSPDMYSSVDKAVHKLERILRRYKDRLKDHHKE